MKNILTILLLATITHSHTIDIESMDSNYTITNKTFTNSLILATRTPVTNLTFKESNLTNLVIRTGKTSLVFNYCSVNNVKVIALESITVTLIDSNVTNLKATPNVKIIDK